MPQIIDIYAVEAESGEKLLAFSATVANVGPGPLLVHAARVDERSDWRVTQRFMESDGSTSERLTDGAMVYGGHRHDHWHLRAGTSYRLARVGGAVPLRIARKQGFCFFDQLPLVRQPPHAPKRRVFGKDVCDGEDRRQLSMGLSPGWADPYVWTLPDQRLDVTGRPDGDYRLHAMADPDDWFVERNEANNGTWVDIRLTTSASPPRVVVLERGPSSSPPVRLP